MKIYCYSCKKTWEGNPHLLGEAHILCEKCLKKLMLSLDK